MRGLAFSRLLMLVVLMPLAGLAIFGGKLTYESWSRYSDLSRAATMLRLAVASARFAGIAIPSEGSLNRDMILGRADRSQIEPKRGVFDEVTRALREAEAGLTVKVPRIEEQLRALDETIRAVVALRPQIDANALKSPNDSSKAITPAAAGSVDLVGSAANFVEDPALSRRISALYTTIQFVQTANGQRGPGEVVLRGTVLPQDAFMLLARSYVLNIAFNKLFHDSAPRAAVAMYDAFYAANGRELDDLRRMAIANTGQPASDAQVKRWVAMNEELSALTGKMLIVTADTVSAEGEQMLSDARFDIVVYLVLTLGVVGAVVLLGRKVLGILRELLGELAGAMDKMRDGNYDVEIPHVKRSDEIGIMARATEGFRENFVRVQAAENEKKNAQTAAERKTLMGRLAGEFEAAIGNIVGAVSSASGELTATATTLTATADTTQKLTGTVAAASE